MTLPTHCRIDTLGDTGTTAQDVIDLWEREGVVTGEEALRRVHEVLLIASHRDDGVIGVASAYLAHNEQLRMGLWHYRVFVASAHRRSNIALHLASAGHELLEQRFVSAEDRRGSGVIFEVENPALRSAFPQAVWKRTGFTFIAQNERGAHVRVRYFAGAIAPPGK